MADVKQVMREYFLDLDQAARDPKRRVAWCTSVGPAEILRAMDFEVFFPENHGAMLGSSRLCMETMPVTHAMGYSPDICSYLTSDIGAWVKGITPLTGAFGIKSVPRPDVLVYNTNQCRDVMYWFDFYAEKYGVKSVGIHSARHLREVDRSNIDDVVAQFRALIGELEQITGTALDAAKLARSVALSKEATDLWCDVLNLGMERPSPFTFFDATIFMGPIVVLRGTEVARDYYRALYQQMKQKVERGEGAVADEAHRLYWDGMPIWGRLRNMANLFKEHGACIVASTYCNSWIFSDFDPQHPLESMASAYLKIFINRDDHFKEDYIKRLVQQFSIDGVIFHNAKTCPNNSNNQYNLPNKLRESGIESVTIDGDLCDLRCYSDEQSATIIEAFLESLDDQ